MAVPVVLVLLIAIVAAADTSPTCNCSPPTDSSHASGYFPVTFVPSPPSHVVTVTFAANNEHDPDEDFTPLQPRPVNLTLDSSCNQIILPWQDCFALRLQDICYDRAIACNATVATCGSHPGEPVFPSQTPLQLLYNGSSSFLPPSTDDKNNAVPVLCSSGHVATAGIAPYRLSLVVQMHTKLHALSLPKMFGYCLGRPRGYFFVGQPSFVFSTENNSLVSASMQDVPTLRWDEDRLPVLKLTGMAVRDGDQSNVTAPLDESVFQEGLEIGTGSRYLTLVDPAYQWLRSTMMSLANSSDLTSAPSPFPELDLCYTLQPNMSIRDGGPQLELRFDGGQSWVLEAGNFLAVTPDGVTVCLGVVSAGQGMASSLGTLQQEEVAVLYNFEQQAVSVSQFLPRAGASCGQLAYPA